MLIQKCGRLLRLVVPVPKQSLIMPRRTRHKYSYNPQPPVLRVLVDMDGVLCDFEKQFIVKFREAYPDKEYIPLEKRRAFYLSDDYDKLYENSLDSLLRPVYEAKDFFGGMEPIEGGVDAVKEMSGMDGVEVFICTSPVVTSQYCVQEKFNWVAKHFGKDWMNRVIITKDKTVVKGHLLIDDKPYIKGKEMPPMFHHILFSCWHNLDLELSNLTATRRLDSWTSGQWKEIIQEYKKQVL